MQRSIKKFTAGRMDDTTRSDCLVEVELKNRGGITLVLESKVDSLYGDSIRGELREACAALGLVHAAFRITDQGALPYVLGARIEAAIRRALPDTVKEYLPPRAARRKLSRAKGRLRRTRLYLPGNEPRFFSNAGLHGPDGVVLDLEDSVAPGEKDAARLVVRNALRSAEFYGAERMVRINQGRTGMEDLRSVVPQAPDVVVIPKCEDPDAVREIGSELGTLEKRYGIVPGIMLLPIIESALGVVSAYAIASSSSRICALAIGLEDYTADIGVERTAEGFESLFARMTIVNAAKAAGVQALDSVFSDIDDTGGLRDAALHARSLGFDGMGCIHPRQIEVIHAAFAPSAEEIRKAEEVVRAAQDAQRRGSGVVALGSKMVDPPVVMRAERILLLAGRSGAGGGEQ
jgi:citrate lyase subunit beta / citryl-CoA lyase